MVTSDLVEKAKNGDEDSFIELIESNKKLLYYILKKYINNDDDIADISQNTILKTFKYIKGLKDHKKFKTWFMCIAINEARLFIKSKLNYVPMDESVEISHNDKGFGNVELKDLIDRLEGDLRDIIDMHYLKDISIKNISEHLNLPEGTVKYKLHSARKLLYQKLLKLYKK